MDERELKRIEYCIEEETLFSWQTAAALVAEIRRLQQRVAELEAQISDPRDADINVQPHVPSGTIPVRLQYAGRSQPLTYDEETAQ